MLFDSNKIHSADEITNHLQSNGYTVVAMVPEVREVGVPNATGTGETKSPRLFRTYRIKDAQGNVSQWSFMQQPNGGFQVSGYVSPGEEAQLTQEKSEEEKSRIRAGIQQRNGEMQERAYYQSLGIGNFTHKEYTDHVAKMTANQKAQEELRVQRATAQSKIDHTRLQNEHLQAQTNNLSIQGQVAQQNAATNATNAATNKQNADTNQQNVIGNLAMNWARAKAEEMIKRGTLTAANAETWIKNQVEQYKALLEENRWIVDAATKAADLQKQQRDQEVTMRGQDIQGANTAGGQALEGWTKLLMAANPGKGNAKQDIMALKGLMGLMRGNVSDAQQEWARPAGAPIPQALQQMGSRALNNPDAAAAFNLGDAYNFGHQAMTGQLGAPIFSDTSPYSPGYAKPADDAAVGSGNAPRPDPTVTAGTTPVVTSVPAPAPVNRPAAAPAIDPALGFDPTKYVGGNASPYVPTTTDGTAIPVALTSVESDPMLTRNLLGLGVL